MKRLFLLLCLVPLLAMTIKDDKASLIGKWIGEDHNEIGFLNFDAAGYASFEIDGQVFGGKDFTIEGKRGAMTYEVDDKEQPMKIDLTITIMATGEKKKLLCIAQFLGPDTLKFAINLAGERPTDFDADQTIIFKRMK